MRDKGILDLRRIDSPYKVTYWAYLNSVRKSLGKDIEYIPRCDYTLDALRSFDLDILVYAKLNNLVEFTDSSWDEVLRTGLTAVLDDTISRIGSKIESNRVSNTTFIINYDTLLADFYYKSSGDSIDLKYVSRLIVFYLEEMELSGFTLIYKTESTNPRSTLLNDSLLYYYMIYGYFDLRLPLSDSNREYLNSILFRNLCKFNGYFGQDLISKGDKIDNLARLGIVEGSIVFLYGRKRDSVVSGSTFEDYNFISGSKIAKVVEITDKGVHFEVFNFNSSLEDLYVRYYNLSKSVRDTYHSFNEFIRFNCSKSVTFEPWSNLGVQYMMNDDAYYYERSFITKLDSIFPVEITTLESDNAFVSVSLKVVDAIYYLLLEYGVDFDRVLYNKEYKTTNPSLIENSVVTSIGYLEGILGYKLLPQ